ncbi:hypothetical protein HYT53_00510 [Candidatus Woesearchaeota archaeon]|nr:hypothetical protein [Candidatus Woesearchaeota archaeon]
MALTYFNLEKEHVINHYRFKPLKDGFLLTNDFGFWVYLSKEEFDLIMHGKIEQNQALFSLLKEKGFVLTQDNADDLVNGFRQRSRHLFRGTYNHVISLDGENFDEVNVKKIADFIVQSPSRELIVKFKGKLPESFEAIGRFAEEFKKTGKSVQFSIELGLESISYELVEFLISNKFDVWIALNDVKIPENTFELIKQLQRRHRVNFYLDVSDSVLGKEQDIVDFFAENNFRSFFARKAKDVNKDDFMDFWKKTIDYAYDLNRKNQRIVFNERLASILLNNITSPTDVFYPELSNFCTGAVVSELGYTLDGDIFANEESIGIELFKIGDASQSYDEVVSGEEALSLISSSINSSPFMEMSVFKPYMGNCPVCNYMENGNIIPKYSSERNYILSRMLDYLFEKVLLEGVRYKLSFY